MTIDSLIEQIAKGHLHRTLYHFTDVANFISISEYGLLSKQRLSAIGLTPPRPGGNELSRSRDEARGIGDFVSLCMTRSHPMEFVARKDGRLEDPRYLKIDPAVLRLPGVRFAFGVANATDTMIVDLADAIPLIDTEVLYTRTDWKDPAVHARLMAAEKYEILIPKSVPVGMILGLT